jgi:hypothetical protein
VIRQGSVLQIRVGSVETKRGASRLLAKGFRTSATIGEKSSFPVNLRPKLLRRRYQAERDRLLALDLRVHHGYWGGEVAGQRLTGYLKPARFTVYLEGEQKALLTQARMRLDRDGNTEVLQVFWNLPVDEKYADVFPPLLTYADLMATEDGRNLETARLIYERFLEPIHGR